MTVSNIKELMAMICDSDFQFADIQGKDFHLIVSKRPVPDYPSKDGIPTATSVDSSKENTPLVVKAAPQDSPPLEEKSNDTTDILSPLVGIAYVSPSPGSPPFVKVGDTVKKGQVVCIVEAMKIMNEIKSEIDGTVVEIMIENESIVEFSQPLIRIKEDK